MTQPVWIDLIDCLSVHAQLLSRFGGLEGIRDEGMLESALARPRHLFGYGETSFARLAAAYAAGVVKNHPFCDGNKRTGFTIAAVFLEINGWVITAPEEEAVLHTLGLAAGEVSEAAYADWLARSCEGGGTSSA